MRIIRVTFICKEVLLNGKFPYFSLRGNEIPEEGKFLYVAEILKKAIELSAPETHVEHEDLKHLNMSPNSSISGDSEEIEFAVDELPVEKVLIFTKIPIKLFSSLSSNQNLK